MSVGSRLNLEPTKVPLTQSGISEKGIFNIR